MSAFPARYPAACAGCDERIAPGDLIRREEGAYVHADCGDHEPPPQQRDHPVCPTCWLTHPEGACDR